MTEQASAVVRCGTSAVTIPFVPPRRLSDLLAESGFPAEVPCGGHGKCGRCRVVAEGALSEPTDAERRALSEADLAAHVRLACRTTALGDVRLEISSAVTRAAIEGAALTEKPTADDGYGVAVDIGTTTLAAYLYDFSDGRMCGSAAADNPQRAFGADVVTRMERAMHGDGAALQTAVTDGVAALLRQLCREADVPSERVTHAVMVGNTVMLTLFLGYSPAPLSTAPFEPAHKMDEHRAALSLGWTDFPSMDVYFPPCPAAYIGADTVAALLSVEATGDAGDCRLLADVGTNGEMVLLTPEGRVACSAAAGPALEGADIRCGTTARDGAISRVALLGGKPECIVLGGGRATGLCGSGLLDAVTVLGTAGVIDREGRLHENGHDLDDYVRTADGEPAFFLPDGDVFLTQSDIRSVQLAKAAIRAGMDTLLETAGRTAADVDTLWLAGGFGSRLSVTSAAAVGLIPPETAAHTRAVGNAAGNGACRMLLYPHEIETAREIARSLRVLTLNDVPSFESRYVAAMRFDRFPRAN